MARILLFLLRISLGWLFFYAGIVKVLDSSWSSAGYLAGAKTFAGLYGWLASPGVIPVTDFLNAWGLTLIGAALMLGVAVRLAGTLGAAMMLLYYFPILDFPRPSPYAFIVDEHIVYAVALALLASVRAGRLWGLESRLARVPFIARRRRLRALLT